MKYLYKIDAYWHKVKNFFRYGRIGWNMYCDCCYDGMLRLMIERLKQMEDSPLRKEFLLYADRDIKTIKTFRILLQRINKEEVPGGLEKIGVYSANLEGDAIDDWLDEYKKIPNAVRDRRSMATKRDLDYAVKIMRKYLLSWWV